MVNINRKKLADIGNIGDIRNWISHGVPQVMPGGQCSKKKVNAPLRLTNFPL